jgi:hypothetical protein
LLFEKNLPEGLPYFCDFYMKIAPLAIFDPKNIKWQPHISTKSHSGKRPVICAFLSECRPCKKLIFMNISTRGFHNYQFVISSEKFKVLK